MGNSIYSFIVSQKWRYMHAYNGQGKWSEDGFIFMRISSRVVLISSAQPHSSMLSQLRRAVWPAAQSQQAFKHQRTSRRWEELWTEGKRRECWERWWKVEGAEMKEEWWGERGSNEKKEIKIQQRLEKSYSTLNQTNAKKKRLRGTERYSNCIYRAVTECMDGSLGIATIIPI